MFTVVAWPVLLWTQNYRNTTPNFTLPNKDAHHLSLAQIVGSEKKRKVNIISAYFFMQS